MKFSNSQLNKLKSGRKIAIAVNLNVSSNITCNSNDKNSISDKLLSNNTQVQGLCTAFVNNSSTHIKLSKTQLSQMVQLGGFLERLFEHLLKTSLLLMKNVLKLLPKSTLRPLGLNGDLGIRNYTIISNEEMYDIVVEQSFLSSKMKQSVIISNKLAYTSCFTSCQL